MKYTTLDNVKNFGRALAPVGQETNVTDDYALERAIARAEEEFDCSTGTAWQHQVLAAEMVPVSWVTDGWLHLMLRFPIVSVSSVAVLDRSAGQQAFTTLTLVEGFVTYPMDESGPHHGSWEYQCLPSPMLADGPRGRLLVKAAYTAGYETFPLALVAMVDRLAWWYYQVREMPGGHSSPLEDEAVSHPGGLPRDFTEQVRSWRRLPA